jgi:hypothetical protein
VQQEQAANNQAAWEKWFHSFYGELIATERAARQKELKAAVEEQERKHDAKLAALEQRQHQAQQEQTTNNQAAWEKFYGEVLATERAARQKEVKAAIEGAQRAVDAKLEALEQRIEQHTDQCNHGIVVSAGRAETLGKMIETERTDRQKEIKATVEEAQRAFETKLAPLEQRIIQHTDQRIIQHIEQCSGRTRALSDVIATERADRQKGVKTTVEQVQHSVEVKLDALEQRLKMVPGKLPVAKTWHPETVVYQAEFVSHEGALYQAKRDTAQPPNGTDWVCVARAGRDAITPNVRGTFSADEAYKQLDIVVSDGAAFIARCDSPGICPGDGWQLLSRQGRAGRRGETGERGMRGERGVKGEPGPSIVSWQIDRERYRASPLMSDGTVGPTLELRPLFETFLLETTS